MLVARKKKDKKIVNLGGEGEVAGAINVQPAKIGSRLDLAEENARRVVGKTDQPEGDKLPFPFSTVDEVHVNNAPLDAGVGRFAPSFTSDEVNRILKPDGKFIVDGVLQK